MWTKEKAYAWKKEYYRKLKETNPEKFRDQNYRYSKKYRDSHKAEITEYNRNWRKKNPLTIEGKLKSKISLKNYIIKKRKFLNRYCSFVKRLSKCFLCKESDPACLDFHHKNPNEKFASVSQYHSFGWNIKRIRDEILKCNVLCSNCHRKHHS